MATNIQTDLAGFHAFVSQQLESDPTSKLSLEDALELWRHRQVETEAIREGIRAVDEGRTMSLEEFNRRLRERHPSLKDA